MRKGVSQPRICDCRCGAPGWRTTRLAPSTSSPAWLGSGRAPGPVPVPATLPSVCTANSTVSRRAHSRAPRASVPPPAVLGPPTSTGHPWASQLSRQSRFQHGWGRASVARLGIVRYVDAADDLAKVYVEAVVAAKHSGISVEPEAQLTGPVKELFEALAPDPGSLVMLREAQLDGVRPDFAVLYGGRHCGWAELKAPGKPTDGTKWRGREAKQWALLAALDALIVCNGEEAQLYRTGVPVGEPATLPLGISDWDPEPLRNLLLLFSQSKPLTIRRVSDLSIRLAPLARLLRDRVRDLCSAPGDTPIRKGLNAWAAHVHNGVTDAGFANDLAQVIAYSLAIAALRGGADINKDNLISLKEARQTIEGTSPVLSAALGPVLGVKGLLGDIRHEVAAIERLASAVDASAVAKSTDPRGEPWLWFYEDFLRAFDPEQRRRAGVYYTPTAIVQTQVRLVEYLLRNRFDRDLGFGDSSVVTLDPASGSGTYPLAVIDAALERAVEQRGPAGPAQIAGTLARNLIAFELMPGPYAVSHLRIGQRIAEASGDLIPPEVRVYLTDTLDDPTLVPATLSLWGDVDILAEERRRAQAVKREEPVMVVLGNPPYGRVSQGSGAGGWIVSPGTGRALFDDILEPIYTIFSHTTSLYNLYVYFWRWSLWKTFESAGAGPAIVSFITASSWLTGPGFIGLRMLVQDLADEIWVCDLGGESRGGVLEENVFDIKIPVAIVTVIRDGASHTGEAPVVWYRRVGGTRSEKLLTLESVDVPDLDETWERLLIEKIGNPMAKLAGDADWRAMPALADLFPWQMAGVYANRTWPISPSRAVLEERWRKLLAQPTADQRAEAFSEAPTGRKIHTRVRGLTPISNLQANAPHRPIERYAFRSFDRQWILNDPRLINLERPALWASRSDKQIFMSTMTATPIGPGPAISVSTAVPDRHHFCGRGGKDVIPLYRDQACRYPNVTAGLLAGIGQVLRVLEPAMPNPTPEDLTAYEYAILSCDEYQKRFVAALVTPGPRVPVTADPSLFVEARDLGREQLWLQTFGARFNSPARSGKVPRHPTIAWVAPVIGIPSSAADIVYNDAEGVITIGAGEISGVRPEVWDFSITGWKVVQKWLAFRTAKGTGRSATSAKPLDLIRPSEWLDEWNIELLELLTVLTRTVALYGTAADLLDRILQGPMITADQLPVPSGIERKEPTA